MNANELRIGNWVNLNWDGDIRPQPVSGITKACVLLIGDWEDDFSINEISPIPLSADVLEKCGFRLTDDGISPYWRLELMRTEVISIEDDWSVGLNAANENSGMGYATGPDRVKYLHQLQNLYYSLTGTELNYTP